MMDSRNDNADFWFAKVDADVVRDKELSLTARLIFTILCTFADKDKRGCWPSNEAVAEAAGVSKSTVIRAYKELEARGVIARSDRFNDGGQTSSYTRIVGHNASCYDGVAPMTPPSSTDATPPVAPMTHGTRINEQEKDSLKGEAPLPDLPACPLVFENGQPVTQESPKPHNPEETHSPSEAPDVMKSTADLLLLKTGRTGLSWEEISALRTLSATQYPARVQKEIDRAITRFNRKGRPLHTLTFMYIAGSLEHQPSLAKKREVKPTPAQTPEHSNDNADAEMAEIEAILAKFDKEAQGK